MINNYKIITLCGSTKFKEQYITEQKRLTLEGNIVISVGLFGHSGDDEAWTEGTKMMLDDIHKSKIDLADEIFVINVDGYIGSSTKNEIEYALSKGKKVNYLVKPQMTFEIPEGPLDIEKAEEIITKFKDEIYNVLSDEWDELTENEKIERKLPKEERDKIIDEKLKLVGFVDWNKFSLDQLADYLESKYQYLSSGEALAILKMVDFYRENKK